MHITFNLFGDGNTWPAHGGERDVGALGSPVVGPAGLLDIIETALGRSFPHVGIAERIADYQARLATLTPEDRYWSRSFEKDPWATARLVLNWRDDLLAAGWVPAATQWASRRLGDLAAAELAGPTNAPGSTDRLSDVARLIAAGRSSGVTTLRLVDKRAHLPVGWRSLIDILETHGTEVLELNQGQAAPAASGLGQVQRWLSLGHAPTDGHPDGSVLLLAGTSTINASDVLAQWLASLSSEQRAVLIAQGDSGHVLDLALTAGGGQRVGGSWPAPFRGSLQVLPLAFQLAWRPFDVQALLDLLTLQHSPVPGRAASKLASTLERTPSIVGPHWQQAWDTIEEWNLESIQEGSSEERAVRAKLGRWRAWTDSVQADPTSGLDVADAVAICDRVADWAVARYETSGSDLYLSTARVAGDARRALLALGRTPLPKTWVDRVVDQVMSDGINHPGSEAEAGRWRTVSHPGAIWAPVDTVVWWDFRDVGERPGRSPWTASERAELDAQGCRLDDDGRASLALSAGWERAVLNAARRLVFVRPGLPSADTNRLHPLAHRLAPVLRNLGLEASANDALYSPQLSVAGTELPQATVQRVAEPEARPTWSTPQGFAGRLEGRNESATSLQALLECQLKWALKHVARVRPSRARSIPDTSQLLGNVAHALAQRIFEPGAPPDPGTARETARSLVQQLVERLAAPLHQNQYALEYAQARARLPEAIEALAHTLRSNRLTVRGTELPIESDSVAGTPLKGYVDMLTEDENGGLVILDLKWTNTRKRRVEELASGGAVQLATYTAMLSEEAPTRAGYFLLKQSEFIASANSELEGSRIDAARELDATWTEILSDWDQWASRATDGELRARGLELAEEGDNEQTLALEPHCDWCEFAAICRV